MFLCANTFSQLQGTGLGHSMPLICQRGFDCLERLASAGRFHQVVECLNSIAPFFFTAPKEASSSAGFCASLLALAEAERSVFRKAREFVGEEFPGKVVEDLGNMVQKQVLSYKRYGFKKLLMHLCVYEVYLVAQWRNRTMLPSRYGFDSSTPVILFWMKVLTKLPSWNSSREVLYVMNILCEEAFFDKSCFEPVMTFFSDIYEVRT